MRDTRRQQTVAFGTLWVAYCVVYFLRKPLGVVKPELGACFHLSHTDLGWLDLSLMLPYAVVQILFSSSWDWHRPRNLLTICLTLSSLSMLVFSVSFWFPMACLCLFISGAAQAPIWPAITKVLTAWYPEERHNSVFGAFSTACYVGALVGTAMAIYLQDHYNWRWVFLPSGVMGLLISLVVRLVLRVPKETNNETTPEQTTTTTTITTSFNQLWTIPAVKELVLAVFCLKFVRYCMYMWLPMYLIEHLGYERVEGGLFSTMFDIGGILGGPALGVLVDKFYPKNPMMGIFYLSTMAVVSFVLIGIVGHWGSVYVSALLLLAGAANCGPDPLLTGSVPMMVGEKYGRGLGAGVTSLVNGIGSLGAIVEGPVVGVVSQYVGWRGVMGCMVLLAGVTSAATLRAQLVVGTAVQARVVEEKEVVEQEV